MNRSDHGVPDGFLELPEIVYRDAPQWIPEAPEATERAFSRSNPWFERGEVVTFCMPGQCRSAAFFVPSLLIEEKPAAFFGYFESIGDAKAEKAVMGAAEEWARGRGATTVYGPINFSTYGPYRLRLEAEADADTFIGEPYNPPTYPAILEALGYELHQTYCTQIFDQTNARAVAAAYGPVVAKVRAAGYRFEHLTPDLWMTELERLHPLVDVIFQQNFAYTPLGYQEFAAACGEPFAKKMCPVRSLICFGPAGDIAGFLLVYPHYGPLVIRAASDARLATAELVYEQHSRLLPDDGWDAGIYKTVGVAPEHRRTGVMEAFTGVLLEHGLERVKRWFGAMMREDNPSVRVGSRFASAVRRYGLYRKLL